MNSLVMDEETERLVLVTLVLHPVDTHVCHNIGQIAFLADRIVIHSDKGGIVVITLSRQDFPIIKPRGQADQMPFADEGRLITRLAEQLGHSLL